MRNCLLGYIFVASTWLPFMATNGVGGRESKARDKSLYKRQMLSRTLDSAGYKVSVVVFYDDMFKNEFQDRSEARIEAIMKIVDEMYSEKDTLKTEIKVTLDKTVYQEDADWGTEESVVLEQTKQSGYTWTDDMMSELGDIADAEETDNAVGKLYVFMTGNASIPGLGRRGLCDGPPWYLPCEEGTVCSPTASEHISIIRYAYGDQKGGDAYTAEIVARQIGITLGMKLDCINDNCAELSDSYEGIRQNEGVDCRGYMDFNEATNGWSACSVADFTKFVDSFPDDDPDTEDEDESFCLKPIKVTCEVATDDSEDTEGSTEVDRRDTNDCNDDEKCIAAVGSTQGYCKGACDRPPGWCSEDSGHTYLATDCDADGIDDPTCFGSDGEFGVIQSSNDCGNTWPDGVCKVIDDCQDDALGAVSPTSGQPYDCEPNRELCLIFDWFKEACMKSCHACTLVTADLCDGYCQNSGSCTLTLSTAKYKPMCKCTSEYTGDTCEILIPPFTIKENAHCYDDKYVNGEDYVTLQQAQAACAVDETCGSVYDNACDGAGTFHLCPTESTEYSSYSCVYEKYTDPCEGYDCNDDNGGGTCIPDDDVNPTCECNEGFTGENCIEGNKPECNKDTWDQDGYNSGCCTEESPCGEEEGDCDLDEECFGDLVCGQNNCGDGFPSSADCCQGTCSDGFQNQDETGVDCGGATCSPCEDIVNGGWGAWSRWSSCDVTCGGGTHSRSRECDDPAPQNGGNECSGTSSESLICNSNVCPSIVNGGWGEWSSWSSCDVTCGGGTHSRTRECDDPAPQNGGNECSGTSSESLICNSNVCPSIVNGGWGEWSSWTNCDVTCGGGTRSRTRDCDDPTPQNDGDDCSGNSSESSSCNTNDCSEPTPCEDSAPICSNILPFMCRIPHFQSLCKKTCDNC